MASDLRGYTADETLNKVLNTSNDSIQVDIVDATGVTITSTNESVYVDDADWTNNTSSHTLVGGLFGSNTITSGDTGPISLATDGAVHIDDGGNSITVDGTVTVSGLLSDGHNVTIDNASDDEVYVRGSGTAGSADTAVLTVQGIASGVAQPVSGTFFQSTQPVSLASVPSHAVTNAGTFLVQSTLSAADGVDIGDVDVASVVPGYAATSLGKREDDAHSNLDVGVMSLAVRNDDVAAIGSADGDYAPLQVNAAGSLYTTDATGEAGSILVTGTDPVTTTVTANTVFVAIQFIEDSVFDSTNATGLVSATDQLYPSSEFTSTSIDADAGDVSDSVTFPQGMTIFGRWDGFKLASGKVIAYIAYV